MQQPATASLIEHFEIRQAKKQAKALQKALNHSSTQDPNLHNTPQTKPISLSQCQNQIAVQKGYSDWYHFCTTVKNRFLSQSSLENMEYVTHTPEATEKYPVLIKEQHGQYIWLKKNAIQKNIFIESQPTNKIKPHQDLSLQIALQNMNAGKHLIFLDGTGNMENTRFLIEQSLKINPKRTIKVVSFLEQTPVEFKPYLTNINPLKVGSAGGLTQWLVSLAWQHSKDSLEEHPNLQMETWIGRSIAFIYPLLLTLCYLRDKNEIVLDTEIIQELMVFEKYQQLAKREDLPSHIIKALNEYFNSIPDYQQDAEKQSDRVMNMHGYIQMEFIKVFNEINNYENGTIFENHNVLTSKTAETIVFLIPSIGHKYEQKFASTLSLGLLKLYCGERLGTILEKDNKDSTHKPKETVIIIKHCPMPKGWAVVSAQVKGLRIGLCFEYTEEDLDNLEINACHHNCQTKLTQE